MKSVSHVESMFSIQVASLRGTSNATIFHRL